MNYHLFLARRMLHAEVRDSELSFAQNEFTDSILCTVYLERRWDCL